MTPGQGDGGGHGHHHVAGMGDGRVGQQPLHVRLAVGGQVAEGAGHCSQEAHQAADIEGGRRRGGGEGHGQAHEQAEGRGLRGHREEGAHFRRCALEHVRRPEMEGHGRDLESQAHHEHQPAEDQHAGVAGLGPLAEHSGGHGGKLGRAEHSDQQADAEEHHAGGPRAEDRVFQGRFAAAPPVPQDARKHVGRHAGHLDPQQDDQGVVGRDHQAHAQRGPQHHHVELGGLLGAGHAGDPRHQGKHEQKPQQEHPQGDREAVLDQQAGEERRRSADRDAFEGHAAERAVQEAGGRQDQRQRRRGGQEHDVIGAGPPPRRRHPGQQDEHHPGAERQLRSKRPERIAERLVQGVLEDVVEAHGFGVSFTSRETGGVAWGTNPPGPVWTPWIWYDSRGRSRAPVSSGTVTSRMPGGGS